MTKNFRLGLWRLADPKISITSVASMTIGATIVARDGSIDWLWLAITGLALFCMEVAKNAWGDIFDYDSGADLAVAEQDRTSFSGGKRVLVDQLLTRQQTWGIAAAFGVAGMLLGAGIVFLREPMALWIGLLGFVIGWSYHGPPLQLVYRGWGELDVVLVYGPIIALSTYLIQLHQLSMDVLLLSLPLGIFIMAFLWVNEFPDYAADISARKRNLVVRLGRLRASRVLVLVYLLGFGLVLALPFISDISCRVWWGLLALPGAMLAMWWTWREPETFYRSKPVQAMALLTFAIYPAAVCVALNV